MRQWKVGQKCWFFPGNRKDSEPCEGVIAKVLLDFPATGMTHYVVSTDTPIETMYYVRRPDELADSKLGKFGLMLASGRMALSKILQRKKK